nr:Chain A, noursin [Streptomyces noursei ATCC 11455]
APSNVLSTLLHGRACV